MDAKFVIGIDLGTTNNVLAYAPLAGDEPQVQLLEIPQLVAPGTVEGRTSLPSFLYIAPPHELGSGAFDLPWANERDFAVGELARRQAAELPDRTVGAAKSWLCHSRVDRHQTILPWGAPEEVAKVSPVEASRRYLQHLVDAWSAKYNDTPFAEQRVVLTVPASFDASARELTREAALAAGFPEDFILLEEPQAAVYAWLAQRGDRWRKDLQLDDTLLVCDVGGGTTDLTLVRVDQTDGELSLRRIAVGNHLLVGGDNMDLALAHFAAGRFQDRGLQLDPWQSVSLWHSCRTAKERLLQPLGDDPAESGGHPDTHTLTVQGRGSKLIGGAVSIELTRDDAATLLLDGFFPKCSLDERPVRRRASGFQEIGLPFESEPGVTKHLAGFLNQHGEDGPEQPTHVLFNGGVFRATALRDRLLETMSTWFADAPPRLVEGAHDLDHAVARGAAYYGWSKQHGGVRIRGGTARSYYVGIETSGLAIPGAPRPLRGLCVVPFGMEEGTEAAVPSSEIGLVVGESAQFRFFSSPTRKQDQPGDLLPSVEEAALEETDSLEATLDADDIADGDYVPVTFQSKITELGVFELWCRSVGDEHQWKLEFSVRDDAEG